MLNTISGLLGGGAPAGGDYESIQTVTIGAGGASTVTFSSIPSTYSHLQIRASFTTASSGNGALINFNSDTGANYTQHNLTGNGSIAASGAGTSLSYAAVSGYSTGSSTTYPMPVITDILDYANTNKYKTLRTLSGVDMNGSGEIVLVSNLWLNTAAISTIGIKTVGAVNFNQYSSFALYGIK